jgi:multidrug efflux pump subunit AcrA (membrane-fusion protein)
VNGTIQYLAEDGIYVNDSDVVCIIEDNELQRRYDESLINLEKAQAGLARSKANMDMQYALMEAQVKNNVAATQIANLDTSQLKYLSITNRRLKELELRKVSIEKRKLEKKLKSLGIINNAEIRSWDFQIRRYSNQADKMKEKLDALTIKAPQGGLITKANNWLTNNKNQVGDPVWNGMPIVYIPDLTKMKVKILASEGNYKRINVNDSVEYSFDAMPDNKAKGIIISKAPIGKPIKENSKIKIFEIEASINKADILPGPGLTTNCNVILKRINDTIVVPQIAIFEQDSMKVAYVKGTDKYEMRQVITGTSSQKNAIIVSGLSPNEIISLTKPKSNLISKKVLLPISVINKFKNNK